MVCDILDFNKNVNIILITHRSCWVSNKSRDPVVGETEI